MLGQPVLDAPSCSGRCPGGLRQDRRLRRGGLVLSGATAKAVSAGAAGIPMPPPAKTVAPRSATRRRADRGQHVLGKQDVSGGRDGGVGEAASTGAPPPLLTPSLGPLHDLAGAAAAPATASATRTSKRPAAKTAEPPALILPAASRGKRTLKQLPDAGDDSAAKPAAAAVPAAPDPLEEELGDEALLAAEKEVSSRGRQWKKHVDLLLMGHEQPGSESLSDEVFEKLRSKLDLKASERPMTAYLYSLGLRHARAWPAAAGPAATACFVCSTQTCAVRARLSPAHILTPPSPFSHPVIITQGEPAGQACGRGQRAYPPRERRPRPFAGGFHAETAQAVGGGACLPVRHDTSCTPLSCRLFSPWPCASHPLGRHSRSPPELNSHSLAPRRT